MSRSPTGNRHFRYSTGIDHTRTHNNNNNNKAETQRETGRVKMRRDEKRQNGLRNAWYSLLFLESGTQEFLLHLIFNPFTILFFAFCSSLLSVPLTLITVNIYKSTYIHTYTHNTNNKETKLAQADRNSNIVCERTHTNMCKYIQIIGLVCVYV